MGCDICKGRGVVNDGSVVRKCVCVIREDLRRIVPPEFRESPFHKALAANPTFLNENYLILKDYNSYKAMVKTALVSLYGIYDGNFTFRVATGNQVLQTFFSEDDSVESYKQVDFLSLELGSEYENKALIATIEDTLSYRTEAKKVTWVRVRPDKLDRVQFNYSPEVFKILNNPAKFKKVS